MKNLTQEKVGEAEELQRYSEYELETEKSGAAAINEE